MERGSLQQPLLEEVATLCARLARPETIWTVASSNLFLAARRDELVSDAEFVQFIDSQLETQLITRPRVRAGRTWRVEVKCSTPRLGRSAPQSVPVMKSSANAHSPSASCQRPEKMEVTLYSLHDIRWRDEVLSKRTGGTTWLNLHRGSTLWATTSFEAPGFPGTGTLSGTIRVDVFDPWRDIAGWDKGTRLLGCFELQRRS